MTHPHEEYQWGNGPGKEAIQRIISLSDKINPEALICTYWASTSMATPEQMSDAIQGSAPVKVALAAFHSAHGFGSTNTTDFSTEQLLQFAEDIESIHMYYLLHVEPSKNSSTVDWVAQKIAMQAKHVSGSAFPEQTEQEIREIQGEFEDWFESRAAIGPSKTCDVLWGICRCLEKNANNLKQHAAAIADGISSEWPLKKQTLPEDHPLRNVKPGQHIKLAAFACEFSARAYNEIPVDYNQISAELSGTLSVEMWEMVLKHFGADSAYIASCKSPLEMKSRPLLCLSNNRVILTDVSNALDVTWDFFDQKARQDQSFYNRRYLRKRSAWLENFAVKSFSECFPPECVFSNLIYKDPSRNDNAIAELDILIKWGTFVILCECKSNQFRFERYPNDLGRFRTDVKANVEDAFKQACRARRLIRESQKVIFKEKINGREITIEANELDKVYLVTVSQHHLAGFATRLASLKNLGLFENNEYPVAFCASDLELVCHFCDSPEILLHYIERRKSILHSEMDPNADDLDLFGAYLSTRLILSDIDPDLAKYSYVSFGAYSDQFDKWFSYKRGELPTPPIIQLNIPSSIGEVLLELRKRDDPGAKYIAFALLGLPARELAAIAEGFDLIRESIPSTGVARRISHLTANTAIFLFNFPELVGPELDRHVEMRTVAEKYRLKKKTGIGIGISAKSSRLFDCAFWVEGEWEYNEKMEHFVEISPPTILASGQKKPGRNELCLCGSGKKFKKCCLYRLK